MRPKVEDERRKYFRIIDEIDVSYRVTNSAEVEEDTSFIVHGFEKINADIQAVFDGFGDVHPALVRGLNLLNKKLDMIIAVSELENTQSQLAAYQSDEVSISACGIAFAADEQLEKDTQLNLSLLLHVSQQRVAIRGQVVDCHSIDSEGDSKYCLRVEFIDVDESTREKLIQYILERQRYLLKNLSEELYQGLS